MNDLRDYQRIEKAIQFVRQNYQQQPNLADIAEHIHLSPFHFQRLFQKWTGLSPKAFLQFISIEHARKLLDKGKSTMETAFEIGLSGNGRLHDLFVKIEALSPGQYKNGAAQLDLRYDFFPTLFGLAFVAESARGICQLHFVQEPADPEVQKIMAKYPNANWIAEAGPQSKRLQDWFQNRTEPNGKIILDLKGTPFQIQVWNALLKITSGSLASYGDIAKMVHRPKASRAVGTAIGSNPIAYLIPCHRVIRQNGAYGQYRWGAGRKALMIGMESIPDAHVSS